jgi:hypothetical protein
VAPAAAGLPAFAIGDFAVLGLALPLLDPGLPAGAAGTPNSALR